MKLLILGLVVGAIGCGDVTAAAGVDGAAGAGGAAGRLELAGAAGAAGSLGTAGQAGAAAGSPGAAGAAGGGGAGGGAPVEGGPCPTSNVGTGYASCAGKTPTGLRCVTGCEIAGGLPAGGCGDAAQGVYCVAACGVCP